jgi:hypothetical protein
MGIGVPLEILSSISRLSAAGRLPSAISAIMGAFDKDPS